jgi:hypothetical protein
LDRNSGAANPLSPRVAASARDAAGCRDCNLRSSVTSQVCIVANHEVRSDGQIEVVVVDESSSPVHQPYALAVAKVRFFGDDLALVYGSKGSARKKKEGTEGSRRLIWADT